VRILLARERAGRLRLTGKQVAGLTPEQVRSLLEHAGGLLEALDRSDPVLRAQLYEELGVDGLYDHAILPCHGALPRGYIPRPTL